MEKLNQWFRIQRRKSEAVVTLEETLLGGSFLRYAWFRLRFFVFRTLIEVLLRFIELKILLSLLPASVAYTLIGIRILLIFGSGFWWGALEVFREKIRKLHRAGKLFKIPDVISAWLSFSLLVSLVGLIILLGFSGVKLAEGSIKIEVVYGIICFFRFLLEVPLTTFHSGIYAMRRIYRPLYWILIVELIGSLGALALFPLIGIWGLPLTFLVSSLINFSVRFYYTKKVYYFYRYWPLNLSFKKWPRFLPLFQNDHFFLAGLSYALMRYEVLLLILFFHHLKKETESGNILALLFLLTPLLVASREWAQMFYFDFKRLEGELFENFRRQLQRQVENFSLLWGFIIWLVILGLSQLILNTSSFNQFLWLAPFFLINSLLAYEQVKAFSDRNYSLVIQSGLVFLVGTIFLWQFLPNPTSQFAYLSLTTLGALRQVKQNMESSHQESFHLVPLLDWLKRLKNLTEPVKLGWLEINEEEKTWQLQTLAENIQRNLNNKSEVSLCLPNKVLWFETDSYSFKAEELVKIGAGLLSRWSITPIYPNGATAIQKAPVLKEIISLKDNDFHSLVVTKETLIERFKKNIPKGFIYDLSQDEADQLSELSAKERRQILFDAIYFSKNLLILKKHDPFEVTTLCKEGTIELIFVIPKTKNSSEIRSQWADELRYINLIYAIA